MTNREKISELLLLTPDIVKKSNYTMGEKKFNALAVVYTYILFLMSSFQLLKEDFKSEFLDICEHIYIDSEYYYYQNAYNRIMGKIKEHHGDCTTREKSSWYRDIANRSIKEQYVDYYKVVKAFYDNKTDSDIDYIFTDPGREYYVKVKEILEMRKENEAKREEIVKLQEELDDLNKKVESSKKVVESIEEVPKITVIQRLSGLFKSKK